MEVILMKKIYYIIFIISLLLLFGCSTNNERKVEATINADTINQTYNFQNGVAWIECYDSHERFMGLIDNEGNTLFTDYNGLLDSNGDKYFLHSYFDNVNCSYDFSNILDTEFIDTQTAWQFNEGYALVLCEKEDSAYFCLIDTTGNVKYSIHISDENLDYSQICSYYNGNGTYYINWGEEDVFLSSQSGIITINDCHWKTPVRGGYFAYQTQEKDFNTNKTTYCLMNSQGKTVEKHSIENDNFAGDIGFYLSGDKYSIFLNNNIAISTSIEGIFYADEITKYYNVETKATFTLNKPLNTIFQTETQHYFRNFSYDSNKIIYYEVKEENVGSIYNSNDYIPVFNIYSIDENGNQVLIYNHTANQNIDTEMGDYLLGYTNEYALFYFENGVYLVDIENGAEKKVLSDYVEKLSPYSEHYWLTNNLIGARIYGADTNPYCTVTTLNGDVLLELEECNDLPSNPLQKIGDDCGMIYYPKSSDNITLYLNSGNKIELDSLEIDENASFDGPINVGDNYILLDGTLIF